MPGHCLNCRAGGRLCLAEGYFFHTETYTIYNKIKMVVQTHPLLLKPPRHLNLSSFLAPNFCCSHLLICVFSWTLFSAYIFRAFAPLSRRRRTQADDLQRTEAESGTSVKKNKPNIRVYFCSCAILWPDRGITGVKGTWVIPLFSHVARLIRENAWHGAASITWISRVNLWWRKWGETRTKVCEWERNGS